MSKEIKLEAQSRDENGGAKKIRKSGFVLGNIYGAGAENKNIQIKTSDFNKVFAQAGESHLIDLVIDQSAPIKVIVKDTQKDHVKDNIIHVDFYQVDMKKKITAEIPLNFIGESPAVKKLGGILVKNIDTVEVNCLPSDLVDKIEVNLSSLENFHDSIRIGGLNVPQGMELTADKNEIVVIVSEPAKEEVRETPVVVASEVPATAVKGGEDKKKEGEGTKEGKK